VSEERKGIPEEERELFSWVADERPFEKKGKEFFSTIVVLALLISIILYFIEGLMPVLVVWAIVFMVWAVYRTEPGRVKNMVTNRGLITGENFYAWEVMESFWFEGRGDKGPWPERLQAAGIHRQVSYDEGDIEAYKG